MKKIAFLLTLAILMPMLSFATPAETAGVPPSVIDFEALRDYQKMRDSLYQKFDNGLRSWEFQPYEYKQERLQYRNVATREKPLLPGIEYKKLCYHWKNCVRRAYKAANDHNQTHRKYAPPKTTYDKGLDLAFTKNKDEVVATDVRSGAYKLWHWRFITDRNR